MSRLNFWAQSIDNKSPSVLIESGSRITDNDHARRRAFVNKLSSITEQPIFFAEHGATLRFTENLFTMQLLCHELDHAGRQSTVVCFGYVGEDEDWAVKTTRELRQFALSLGRTLDDETIEACTNGLRCLLAKQKKKNPLEWTIVAWIMFFMIGAIMGRLLGRI